LTYEDALAIAGVLKNRGLLEVGISKAGSGQKALIPFLKEFWDYDNSPYVKDKLAHGHQITRRYCHEAILIIAKHWLPYFGNKPLNAVSRQDLRDFSLVLKEKKNLSAKTVNNTLLQGTTALKWAYTEGLIPSDPSLGLTRFSGEATRRDVLTKKETETLFRVRWQDKRAYIGCLLAATSGLRSGEIRAIRKENIGEMILGGIHPGNDFDGVKSPKNGESRRVPLLPEIRGLLLGLLAENPHAENPNPFVFFSNKADRPCSGDVFRKGLALAIKATRDAPPDWNKSPPIGEGRLWAIRGNKNAYGELQGEWSEPEEYIYHKDNMGEERLYRRADIKPDKPKGIDITNRKIDVHSFRHYYCSIMANKIASDKIAKIAGHRSKAMAELYQSHIDAEIIAELRMEAGTAFGNILSFAKGA
jgi:integrase